VEPDRGDDVTEMRPSGSWPPYHRADGDQKDGTRRDRGRDLETAIEFFVQLGLEPGGTGQVEGEWVDRIIALHGTKAELAMLRTPGGDVEIELVKFHSPPVQAATPARRRTPRASATSPFLVEGIDAVVAGLQARGPELVGELVRHENSYRPCCVRGPEGIIVELAEKIG
jgi:catechol 2,3-dioxygenase-like lactoylglutathione lyase family enzyme